MGFAAAIRSIQPEDGCDFAACATQPGAYVGKQIFQSACRVGVGEKQIGTEVFFRASASQDLC